MPDLAGILLRKSVGSLDSGRARCSKCYCTPLTGERLHEAIASAGGNAASVDWPPMRH